MWVIRLSRETEKNGKKTKGEGERVSLRTGDICSDRGLCSTRKDIFARARETGNVPEPFDASCNITESPLQDVSEQYVSE